MRPQRWVYWLSLVALGSCSTKTSDDTRRVGVQDEVEDDAGDVASDESSGSDDPAVGSDTPPSDGPEATDTEVDDAEPEDAKSSDAESSDGDVEETAPSDDPEPNEDQSTDRSEVSDETAITDGLDDVTLPLDDATAAEDGGASLTPTPRVPLNHRASAETCDNVRPPGNVFAPEDAVDGGTASSNAECYSDEDCSEGVNGRCGIQRDGSFCSYDRCFEDTDCSGGPCGCEMGVWSDANSCMSGNCQVDADCGVGGYCSPTFSDCGSYLGVVGYWCHTSSDTCIDDADCNDPGQGSGYCAFLPEVGYWSCSYSQCVG